MTMRVEFSPYYADANAPANTPSWFRTSEYAPAVLAAGVDSASRVQREALTYQATGATQESFVYGAIPLGRTVERVRIACAESGAVGTPGSCAIFAQLG